MKVFYLALVIFMLLNTRVHAITRTKIIAADPNDNIGRNGNKNAIKRAADFVPGQACNGSNPSTPAPYHCPNGFCEGEDGSCYKFVREHYNWFQAQMACCYMKARLVEIDSQKKNDMVQTMVKSYNAYETWVGLNDFAVEKMFVIASTRQPALYKKWADYEPSGHGDSEDCVGIYKTGKRNDQHCDADLPSICEMPGGEPQGNCVDYGM